MIARGTAVYSVTVRRWERKVNILRMRAQNNCEMRPGALPLDRPARIRGWRENWNFADAWGRGPSRASDHAAAPRCEVMGLAEAGEGKLDDMEVEEDEDMVAEEDEDMEFEEDEDGNVWRIEDEPIEDEIGPKNEKKYLGCCDVQ